MSYTSTLAEDLALWTESLVSQIFDSQCGTGSQPRDRGSVPVTTDVEAVRRSNGIAERNLSGTRSHREVDVAEIVLRGPRKVPRPER